MADLTQKFKEFTSKKYSEQAQAFMNAYWDDDMSSQAEQIWDWTHQFIDLDHENGKDGVDLDEFNAHRFLEKLGATKTVKQMRDELREIDMDFNKRMALIEYFLWRNHKTVKDFCSKPQGGIDPTELAEAQRLLDEVKRAQEEAQTSADEAKRTEDIAVGSANEARAREKEALEQEAPFKKAQEELNAAIDEKKRQEDEYNNKINELTARSNDTSIGVVTKNKAANELAQLKSQDPLPLRQAKISLEAAERKADKLRKPFKEARERAEEARAAADKTAKEAIHARQLADEAVDECNKKFKEAEDYFHHVMSRSGVPHGQVWWLERELAEARKFMPTKTKGKTF